jgi:hypothetical protein
LFVLDDCDYAEFPRPESLLLLFLLNSSQVLRRPATQDTSDLSSRTLLAPFTELTSLTWLFLDMLLLPEPTD